MSMALLNLKKKKLLSIFVIVELCLLLVFGYHFFQNKKGVTPRVKRVLISNDRSFNFGSFVIPVKEHNNFSYISLSIGFKMPNKELEIEMIRKRDQIRGLIYDILIEEVNQSEALPMPMATFDNIKEFIIQRTNEVVTSGKINEAYLKDFLAV